MHQMNMKASDETKQDEAPGLAAGLPDVASAAKAKADGEEDEKPWDTPPLAFPARLMQLLQNDGAPEGIYWLPDGKRFAIHTEKIETVLVNKFQGAKWLSFTRTLNKWGFKKALGVDLPLKAVAYQSQFFQKDKPELVKQMVNHSKPANRKRKAQWDEEKAQIEEKPIESTLLASHAALGRGTGVTSPPSPAAANPPGDTTTSHLSALTASASASTQALLQQGQRDEQLRLLQQALRVQGGGLSGQRHPGLNLLLQQRNQANLQADHLLRQRLAAASDIEQQLRLLQSQSQSQQQHPLAGQLAAQSAQLPSRFRASGLNPLALALLEQQQRQESHGGRARSDPPDSIEESNARKKRNE